jgi:hypothetical protein
VRDCQAKNKQYIDSDKSFLTGALVDVFAEDDSSIAIVAFFLVFFLYASMVADTARILADCIAKAYNGT